MLTDGDAVTDSEAEDVVLWLTLTDCDVDCDGDALAVGDALIVKLVDVVTLGDAVTLGLLDTESDAL